MTHHPARFLLFAFALATLTITQAPADAEDRTFNGIGNNIVNPNWGAAGVNFQRLDKSHYADGISAPSAPLGPSPRAVSNLIGVQPAPMPDRAQRSDYVWQWGQFIDHDITLTAGGSEFLPIIINDPGDVLHPMIPMNRSGFDPETGTGMGNPRQQRNEITAFLDASMVYGSSVDRADALRTFSGGQLATSGGGMMMPYNKKLLPNANDAGIEPDEQLFLAGDVRANEQFGLISMHTLFLREHNRLAGELVDANPAWTDEQIYQRSRRIVGAIVQSITLQEYLPALLGGSAPSVTSANYDRTVDPTLSNEFSTAAFRLGHTQVSEQLARFDHTGNKLSPVDLMDAFFRPSYFTAAEDVDYFLHGLAMQTQQATDVHMVDALRNAMFGDPGEGGLDLLSINIQRSRDHGLGSLTDLQAALGLPVAERMADITSDPALQEELEYSYGDAAEVELWIGLLAEDVLPGAAVGPTMAHVIAKQFEDLMVGDRFFYLWDEEFSAEERDLISATRLSDVILRNTEIERLRGNVFFVPEPGSFATLLIGLGLVLRSQNRRGCLLRLRGFHA